MQPNLPSILPDLSKAQVLVVGDVMLDRYWFGDTSRVSPEAPVPIVKINNADNRPGGAGNVALNIAALGAKVMLLGIVGDDEAATLLEQQLTEKKVAHDLCKLKELATIIKLRVISRHQQLLRLDFEEKLHIHTQPSLLIERFKAHLTNTKLVILSDYQKGTLADPQVFIQLARAANVPVLVDPKSTDFDIYRNANIITPNFNEFERIVGHCENEEAIINKGRELLKQEAIESLLITRGENGMTLISATEHTHLPAYAREVFDVTGAGDTVIGTLGAFVAAGLDLQKAMALSNLAASLVVGKLGAATISKQELQAALSNQTSFANGILDEEQLLKAVHEARVQGKKIVFTNGCFDVLHAGHVSYLQHAKQLGDYLIVAVNADESVRELKGENRPINPLLQRMSVLAGLNAVDWIVPFTDSTPKRLLKLIQPDFLVKGGDYTLDQVVGHEIVHAYGGEVRVLNHIMNLSSTRIIEQMTQPTDGEMSAHG